jgi:uncharacterized protein YndB with AHSA1/START domain
MTDDPRTSPDAAAGALPAGTVVRTVELRADADAVWAAISEPEGRAAWLDDPDAAARTVRVDRAEAGRRLEWTWWRPDGDEPDAATVAIDLVPADGGGTHVVVTETPLTALPVARASSRASASAAAGLAGSRWDMRLLGLELVFVAAGACVF